MIWNLSINDAMDVVDAYGPDAALWPKADRAALEHLLNTDVDFSNYVADVRRIEDMLANWTEADDGAEIDWNHEGTQTGEEDFDEPGGYAPSAAFSQDPGDYDEEEDGDEGEAPVIIEIDPKRIQDMDALLADFIQKQMQQSDPTEFRVFTRDYDELSDIVAPDTTSLEPIEQKVAKTTGPLQKDLRRMIAARSQSKRLPGMRRGRLHSPNLHRILAQDDRVFYRREEAPTLDTAISLLIDCSGSMNGGRLTLATETAYAIASVLSRLGVAFECLGFTDHSTDPRTRDRGYLNDVAAADQVAKIIRAVPLVMPKFKTFEERWVQGVQRRFAHVFNNNGMNKHCGIRMGMTPEGCGLEFAARRLLQRKEKRKILICMTDGEPGGSVYAPRSMEDHYAYPRQSVQMVKSIEAAGVDLIGVGIQHAGPTDYYTNAMVIQNIEEMPKQLLALLKKFMVG